MGGPARQRAGYAWLSLQARRPWPWLRAALLCRRVFRKLGFCVSEADIQKVVANRPGAVEPILCVLREKVEAGTLDPALGAPVRLGLGLLAAPASHPRGCHRAGGPAQPAPRPPEGGPGGPGRPSPCTVGPVRDPGPSGGLQDPPAPSGTKPLGNEQPPDPGCCACRGQAAPCPPPCMSTGCRQLAGCLDPAPPPQREEKEQALALLQEAVRKDPARCRGHMGSLLGLLSQLLPARTPSPPPAGQDPPASCSSAGVGGQLGTQPALRAVSPKLLQMKVHRLELLLALRGQRIVELTRRGSPGHGPHPSPQR
ncbi:hypothetical protein J0S82_009747 [Galemys pyrenaicus]|uniref:Uncharacterized protein n=1 Tax=Galemys pyrenaicus TaxID=202257 RepID=A0A8J6AEU6_GALPY|nr:hypothetical protein J0S82_009747 [Galemys pyrenaicus]